MFFYAIIKIINTIFMNSSNSELFRKWNELTHQPPKLVPPPNSRSKELGRYKKRFEILKLYNFTCQYCGRKAPEVILHIEHIFPVSKGGTSDMDNLTVACRACNIGKGATLLNDLT